MVAGAAGDDVQLAGAGERGDEFGAEGGELQFAVRKAAFEGVGDGVRLLEDFFLHIVFVAVFAGEIAALCALINVAPGFRAARVVDGAMFAADAGEVVFLQGDEAAGDGQQRVDVGGSEVFADAEADDHRRAVPRGDDFVGAVGSDNGDGIRPAQAGGGLTHGAQQVVAFAVVAVNEVGDGFGVGVRGEGVTRRAQFVADFLVVFDDAVVDDGDVGAAHVWVRVGFARYAVGRPAGVGDAAVAVDIGGFGFGDEARHFADGAAALDVAAVIDGQPGGVVATVFEPFQAFQQDGDDVAFGYASDDATHGFFLFVSMFYAARGGGRGAAI